MCVLPSKQLVIISMVVQDLALAVLILDSDDMCVIISVGSTDIQLTFIIVNSM